jgi:polysaccharide biosynthesis protein PslG
MLKPRLIEALVVLVILTLPCFGCVKRGDCPLAWQIIAGTPVLPEGFGVNIDFIDPRPGEMKMISEGGFRWVRMDLKWDSTEKEPGRYDFAAYDRLMAALEFRKLRALFILDYGNPLYDKGAPPRTEVARDAFARWAVAAARHFAGRGAIWEIYNEPNHPMFWPPRPKPQEYVALALAVGRAFRENVPEEKLVGPATSEIDFDFLRSCFKAGLLEYWSAVSIHPYRRTDPETAAQDYCRLREMIRAYAPLEGQSSKAKVQTPGRPGSETDGTAKEIPIIASEWGYSSIWPGMSDEKQGQLLARAWLTNSANGILLSIWYDWRDDGSDANEAEHHFGTVSNSYHEGRDPVYDAKPAYLAAKTLSAFFNGYRFEKRFDTGDADDYVLVFRKGSDLRFAAWTTANRARNVLLPLTAGQYAVSRHTGADAGAGSANEKGLAISLTASPVYIR